MNLFCSIFVSRSKYARLYCILFAFPLNRIYYPTYSHYGGGHGGYGGGDHSYGFGGYGGGYDDHSYGGGYGGYGGGDHMMGGMGGY